MSAKELRGRFLGLQEEFLEVTQNLRRQLQKARERAQLLDSRVKELEAETAEGIYADPVEFAVEKDTAPSTLSCASTREGDSHTEKFNSDSSEDTPVLEQPPDGERLEELRACGEQDGHAVRPCTMLRGRQQARGRRCRALVKKCLLLARECALHKERCKVAEQREQEALTHRETVEAVQADFLTTLEAATEKLGEDFQVPMLPKIQGAVAEVPDSAGDCRDREARVIGILSKLQPIAQSLTKAKEVLEGALCCPMSQHTFIKPVLAPDGLVYEESWIVRWLQQKPCSPVSDQPMRCADLLRDRVAEQATDALWLLRGVDRPRDQAPEPCPWPEPALKDAVAEASSPISNGSTAEPTPPQRELYDAILQGSEARALELLQRRDSLEGLNDLIGEERATLLHLALLNGLDATALAIAKHPFFRRHNDTMGGPRQMVTPLHIATSLGLYEVCKALLECCGDGIVADPVASDVALQLKSGRALLLERHDTAFDMARLHGHPELAALIADAGDRFLELW